jgi:hypothetical protein
MTWPPRNEDDGENDTACEHVRKPLRALLLRRLRRSFPVLVLGSDLTLPARVRRIIPEEHDRYHAEKWSSANGFSGLSDLDCRELRALNQISQEHSRDDAQSRRLQRCEI